jgi:hypothetical protein
VETEVQIRLVTLADLTAQGPYARVFLDPLARDPAQPTWPDGTPRFADVWTDLFGTSHQRLRTTTRQVRRRNAQADPISTSYEPAISHQTDVLALIR